MTDEIAAVILAAGQGTRMKSTVPKVLQPVVGLPMVLWSVESARDLGADSIVLVVGNGAEAVRQVVGADVSYAFQAERLGTGHATLQARDLLQGKADAVLVLYADMPTLRVETLKRLVSLHREHRPAMTLLSVESDDSMGFGRVVRGDDGRALAIVEEAVATPEIMAIKELNCGVYCFDAAWLWRRLPDVPKTWPKGEHYLTDMLALAIKDERPVEVVTITDVTEVQGINTRAQLARSERILRERINAQIMADGVTMMDPATTYIDGMVKMGRDTLVYPNTYLQGDTVIGEACVLGPNTIIRDSQIGNDCVVLASVLEGMVAEDHVQIGPFSHVRNGSHLGRGVCVGSFDEVKPDEA